MIVQDLTNKMFDRLRVAEDAQKQIADWDRRERSKGHRGGLHEMKNAPEFQDLVATRDGNRAWAQTYAAVIQAVCAAHPLLLVDAANPAPAPRTGDRQ